MSQQAQPNLKSLPYGGASCVINKDLVEEVNNFIKQAAVQNVLENKDIQTQFLSEYQNWIKTSKVNIFSGLDAFTISAFSNGTTEGFDKFMIKNHNKRFRCLRGEYMYHTANYKKFFNWKFIEDEPLSKNDAVVISVPFSDTGNIHPLTEDILADCDKLNIPVLIDSAFIGICGNIKFNYNRECVTDITFSLSKSFPVANLRIGMRLSKIDNDDGLLIHTKINYNNRISAAVGFQLITKYSADYNYHMYRTAQLRFCEKLSVEASDSVIFGLSNKNFSEYNRGGFSNRLCFSKYLRHGILPEP